MASIPYVRALAHWARRDPDRPAITGGDGAISRGELERRTNRLARAYAALGVRQDRFVTIGLPNGVGFLEAVVATWKLGATPQPISWRLPAREREAIVELADPRWSWGWRAPSPGGRRCPPGSRPTPR